MEILLLLAVVVVVGTPIVLLALAVSVSRLGARMQALTDEVTRLTSRLARRETGEVGTPERPEPAAEPPRPRPTDTAPAAPVAAPAPVPAPPAPDAVPARPSPALAPSPAGPLRPIEEKEPARAPVSAEGLESAIGQRWLVRIGAIVLVTGAGFFYAYAVEQGWIGEKARAIAGAVAGLAIMGLGVRFNGRGFTHLAQGFVGCGSSLLFLDAFASHRFYHLLDAPVALAAMAAVTALTVVIALRWSAMPLVLLAQIGGYLTPILLDQRMPERAATVLAYVLVIDAGFLLVAALRRWTLVYVVAAVATPILFRLGSHLDPTATPGMLVAFACAFDLLFLAMSLGPPAARRERASPLALAVVAVYAAACAAVAENELSPFHLQALAATLTGLAVAHAVAGEALLRRSQDRLGVEVVRALAALLLIDAVHFPFGIRGTTLAFAAAGAVLAFAALARRSLAFRSVAAVAFAIAVGRVVAFHMHGAWSTGVTPFLDPDFATGCAVAAVLAAAAFADRETRWIGLAAAALLATYLVTGELAVLVSGDASPPVQRGTLVLVVRALSFTGMLVGLALAGARSRRWPLVAAAAVHALLACAVFGRLTPSLQRPPQWLMVNPAFVASLAVAAGLLAAAWFLRGGNGSPWLPRALAFAGALVPLVAASVEMHRFFRNRFAAEDALVDAGSAAVSVTWAAYAALVLAIGISRRMRAVRLGALVLLSVTLVKVAVSDLANLDRLARIASFIGLGVVLMAGAWAYHRFAPRIFAEEASRRGAAGEPGPAGGTAS